MPLIDAARTTHQLLKSNWHQVDAVAQRAFKQRTLNAAELMSTIESQCSSREDTVPERL
jgi:hypothetical protein